MQYEDNVRGLRHIKCSWMVGADGKKDVVRKRFLEPTANVKQDNGLFSYTGTWVAANLKIDLPTPETHTDFPLWKLGFTPERVYDLFWPVGWHFCSPPGKPTACGRFGPHKDRLWRHEFAEPHWDESMNQSSYFGSTCNPWSLVLQMRMGTPFRSARLHSRGIAFRFNDAGPSTSVRKSSINGSTTEQSLLATQRTSFLRSVVRGLHAASETLVLWRSDLPCFCACQTSINL